MTTSMGKALLARDRLRNMNILGIQEVLLSQEDGDLGLFVRISEETFIQDVPETVLDVRVQKIKIGKEE